MSQLLDDTVRASYGKLLSLLSRKTRNIALCEDALSEAIASAMKLWPTAGEPKNPEGWLLSVARRKIIDEWRKHKTVVDQEWSDLSSEAEMPSSQERQETQGPLPDERLNLMFVCANPAIDFSVRTALMLQTVMGLTVNQIASAFLMSPAVLNKRLTRAKNKIRASGIPFEWPEEEELVPRVHNVLEAIYGAYGRTDEELDAAAVVLARLMADAFPSHTEVLGLASLLLYCESRRRASRTERGEYVPLDQQDVSLWDQAQYQAAEAYLFQAHRLGAPGPFQIEAAIQSAHAFRLLSGVDTGPAICSLYEALVSIAPTAGALVGQIAAVAQFQGWEKALDLFDPLAEADYREFQPYWALKAELLRRAGRLEPSRQAAQRAAGLSSDPAVRTWLLRTI